MAHHFLGLKTFPENHTYSKKAIQFYPPLKKFHNTKDSNSGNNTVKLFAVCWGFNAYLEV